MSLNKVGLIAGEGKLPILLAENAKKQGVKIIAVGIKGKTDRKLRKYVDKLHLVKLGHLKELLDFLKENSLSKVVMIGKVPKIHLFDKMRLFADKELVDLLKKVKDKKDDSLLKAIANYLENEEIILLDSTMWLSDYLLDKGVLTSRNPTKKENEDIQFGKDIAKSIADLDIGQTVIVKDKAVLAVEAIEHTDEAIKRGGQLGGGNVVVVKVSRPNQDMRFDIPVIGLETIKSLKKARASVLAVENKKTLFIDKEEVINYANKYGITIVSI